MPDGEVSGTINVEVIYKAAGGAGVSASDVTGGGAASGSAAAAATKKNNLMFAEMAKFAKMTAGAVTVGAVIKQSKVMSGFLGGILQVVGALVDIFLMPFIPLLIPLLKGFASVVKWFARFMDDPMAAVKEALTALGSLIKDLVTGFFEGFPTSFSDLADLFGKIDFGGIFETVLKLAVGGIGLVALFGTLSAPFVAFKLALSAAGTGIKLLLGVGGTLARLIGGLGGGGVNPFGSLLNPMAVKIITATPVVAALGLLAGAILGGDGDPGPIAEVRQEFNKWLGTLSPMNRDALIAVRESMSLKDQFQWMKDHLQTQADLAKQKKDNSSVYAPDYLPGARPAWMTHINIYNPAGNAPLSEDNVEVIDAQNRRNDDLIEFHRFDGEG